MQFMHFHVLSHDADEFSKWCPELSLSLAEIRPILVAWSAYQQVPGAVWKPGFDLSLTSI